MATLKAVFSSLFPDSPNLEEPFSRPPLMPTDIFAFVGHLLERSGAYHHIAPEVPDEPDNAYRRIVVDDAIRNEAVRIPTDQLERVMAGRGKSLSFGPEEIDDLLDMEYGDRRMFPLLSLLYPFIDVRQLHHVDHFFPKSQLQRRRLEKLGCDAESIDACLAARDRLANLQLLEGLLNVSKNDSLPADWLKATYIDPAQRQAVLDRHDLGAPPESAIDFIAFYNGRRERMRVRLAKLLSREATESGADASGASETSTVAEAVAETH